ncbi:tyrosine-type recombinase/integrase [Arcobacter sp. YIC-464]|uniref:tyrosine-type recombinase/integrase n=1 Tax=Arcobacter sp. YIC-464 TaxID=3376631 RepID=UPI003C257307
MIKMTQPKLYTRGKKLWVRFSLDGKVIKKSLNIEDSKANRKLAQAQIIPQMLLKVHSGEFFENKTVPTVKEMIDISIQINKKNRKVLTTKAYEGIFKKHIIPYFGNKKINSIKASDLSLWQSKLQEDFSSKYIQSIRAIFNGIFEDALRDEIIPKNPLSLVKFPKIETIKKINPLSKEQIFKILDVTPDKIKAFFAIGFFGGLRTGEITALRYSDIDLENRVIKVNKTRNKGIETVPKTLSSFREVEILDILLPYLNNHIKLYKGFNDDYVFLTRFKKPYYSATKISITYWEKVLKNLNIEHRTLYQMRHTFASMMISNGEDILWVSSMLGHKNANITLQVYAKYVKSEKKKRGSFLLD